MARTKPPKPLPLSPIPANTTPVIRQGLSAVVYHIPTTATPRTSAPALRTTILLPATSTWTSGLHWHNKHTEYLRLVRGAIFVRLGNETRILSVAVGGVYPPPSPSTHRSNQVTPEPPQIDSGGGNTKGEDLIITVDKGVRHNWGRASHHFARRFSVPASALPPDMHEDVVVEEWTAPLDIAKPLFFWNLNGVINAAGASPSQPSPQETSLLQRTLKQGLGPWWVELQLWIIFWHLDNFPVLFELVGSRDRDEWKVVSEVERVWEVLSTYSVLWIASVLGRVIGLEAVAEERTPRDLWEVWARENRVVKKRQ